MIEKCTRGSRDVLQSGGKDGLLECGCQVLVLGCLLGLCLGQANILEESDQSVRHGGQRRMSLFRDGGIE